MSICKVIHENLSSRTQKKKSLKNHHFLCLMSHGICWKFVVKRFCAETISLSSAASWRWKWCPNLLQLFFFWTLLRAGISSESRQDTSPMMNFWEIYFVENHKKLSHALRATPYNLSCKLSQVCNCFASISASCKRATERRHDEKWSEWVCRASRINNNNKGSYTTHKFV